MKVYMSKLEVPLLYFTILQMMFIFLSVSHVLFVIICLMISWFWSYFDIRVKFKYITSLPAAFILFKIKLCHYSCICQHIKGHKTWHDHVNICQMTSL